MNSVSFLGGGVTTKLATHSPALNTSRTWTDWYSSTLRGPSGSRHIA
jgi:hypothetical protein